MNPRKTYPKIVFYALVLLMSKVVIGQETIFQSFQTTPDLNLTIIADWDTVRNLRAADECKAVTVINDTEWKSDLRLRGKNRRRKCDSTLTPLRMQFKKKELRKAGFKEIRNHKIVTCCIETASGLENLQEEILVYQLYNVITDESFRTVEAQLTMSWPDDRKDEKPTPILILEPNKEMADRLGGSEVEKFGYPADSINAASYNRNALFQFMIGNFDWSQASPKNMKMIDVNGKALIVPYDFDYSAIVSPSYATLPSDLGFRDFKDRIYLGEFFLDQLSETRNEFLAKKDELYAHVLAFEGLKKFRRKQINKYLDIFFKYIEKEKNIIEYKMILPFN
jgi:hypothetical protein